MNGFNAVGCLQAKNVGLGFKKRKIGRLPPFDPNFSPTFPLTCSSAMGTKRRYTDSKQSKRSTPKRFELLLPKEIDF
jgi:hypothetical protein